MTTTIKITQLSDIGANLTASTILPVVNMTGTPVTQKTSVSNMANVILGGAGTDYAEAGVAVTVSGNLQPNITSVGTLIGLTVSNSLATVNLINTSNVSLGAAGRVHITGGANGQVLTTNGAGNLTWANAQGIANTGNITFNDDIIASTNDIVNIVGNNYAQLESANTYIWVEDGEADIEVNGNRWIFNNQGYMEIPNDGFFGAINSSILGFSSQNNNPIFIEVVDTGNSEARQWVFDNAGNLTLPNDANIAIYGNTTQFNSCANGFLGLNSYDAGGNNIARVSISSSDGLVAISTTNPDTEVDYNWVFANGGVTLFPILSTQRGDNPSGTISGYTLNIGDGQQEAIITTPDGVTGSEYAQRLVINPGAGSNYGEGGDIYLWAGRGGDGSGSGGDIKIRGGQGGANTSGGNGGDGGYIRIEAGDAASTGGSPGYIDITGGQNNAGQGGYVNVTGGYGTTIGGETKIYGGYGQATGGNVNIWGGASGNGQINEGRVNIQTGGKTWTYDASGNLTLPSNTFAVNYANGTQVPLGGGSANTGNVTFDNVNIIGDGNLNLQPDPANSGSYLDIFLSSGPDIHIVASAGANLILGKDNQSNVMTSWDGNVYIQSWDNNTNTQGGVWTFDGNGSLTLPTISLGVGVDEQTIIQSQRKIIPPFRYSVEITGSTPTVVYTAINNSITSMKVTMQIQHTGLGFEFFDVYATYTGADTFYTVSNRLQPPTIADSTVEVDLNGGTGQMQITVTVNSGAALSWVTYDSTEFGIPQD